MSPLHNKNALKIAIENSSSIKGVLSHLGLSTSGDAYAQVRKWAAFHELELPSNYRKAFRIITLDEKLQKGIRTNSSKLLVSLVKAGLKVNQCEICGQGNTWNGKPLTLHLDHIDGDHDNNLLENLRILCPHCHQQTPTFGSKNMKSKPKKKYFCVCGNEKHRQAKQCEPCYLDSKKTFIGESEVAWPPVEELLKTLENSSFVDVAKKLGVSDNAVRKHIKRHGYEVPKRYKK